MSRFIRPTPAASALPAALFALSLSLSLFLAAAPAAHAGEAYPGKPLRMVVPFAAGSAADTLSRVVAAGLGEQLGQPVVVENKPGAGGTIGTSDIARSAPDGYTIGMAAQGSLINNQVLYDNPGYDSRKDFTPIAVLAEVANVLVVKQDSPYDSVADLAAAIKSKPADRFSFSSSGVGTSHHIAGVVLGQFLDRSIMHVPYKGAPQGLAAIVGGEVDMGLYNVPAAIGMVRGGKLKPLGVTGLKRTPLLPDVPTLDESGLKDYEVTLWFGIIAPAGVPADRVQRLHDELGKMLARPEIADKLTAQGYSTASLPLAPPADFSALIERDLVKWPPILKAMGATAN